MSERNSPENLSWEKKRWGIRTSTRSEFPRERVNLVIDVPQGWKISYVEKDQFNQEDVCRGKAFTYLCDFILMKNKVRKKVH